MTPVTMYRADNGELYDNKEDAELSDQAEAILAIMKNSRIEKYSLGFMFKYLLKEKVIKLTMV